MNIKEKEQWLNDNGQRFTIYRNEEDIYKGTWKATYNNRIVSGVFTATNMWRSQLITTIFDDVKEYLYMICKDTNKKLYDARR